MNKGVSVLIVLALGLGLIAFFLTNNKTESKLNSAPEEINMDSLTGKKQTANSPTPTPMQLQIDDIKEGTGEAVKSGDTIVINYKGKLTNGTEFDSSYKRNQPFETQIGVGRVIKGWDEGVVGMKVGGIRRLTIPPNKGYGAQGVPGTIPPNAVLIFDLELLEIKQS